MKVYLAHRSMPKAAYTTITSSLLAETLVDVVIGPALLIAAYLTGRIPHLPALGHLAAFEWSFFASHARWFMLALAVILILLGVFFTYVERHVVAFWARVRLGRRDPDHSAPLFPHGGAAAAARLVLPDRGHVLVPGGVPRAGGGRRPPRWRWRPRAPRRSCR